MKNFMTKVTAKFTLLQQISAWNFNVLVDFCLNKENLNQYFALMGLE